MKSLAIAVLIFGTGCAVRQPVPLTYRLIAGNVNPVLVPPGVINAELEVATLVETVPIRTCAALTDGPVTIQGHGKHPRLIVRRDELLKQPDDWLNRWASQLEVGRCVEAGLGWKVANDVAESVPMDPRIAFRLLYGEAIDFVVRLRIQVDSPILRDESKQEPAPSQVTTADSGGLRVELKSSDNLLGYERAWFGIEANAHGDGTKVVALEAERHINGVAERTQRPRKNYFPFPAEAGYYRLIYKQEQTEFTAIVLAGRTRAELSANATKLGAGAGNCSLIQNGYCVTIPKGVGANLFLPVMVNGKEELIHWGGTVRNAVATQEHLADSVISKLSISRPHNSKPASIEFDRSSGEILNLRLTGGETISWH